MQLVADSLVLARGSRIVVDGLSLEAPAGRSLLLTGHNGSGKTTLIRGLAGLLAPRSGRVVLEGGDNERPVGEQCHCIGHANGMKADLTVRENLDFWCRFLGGGAVSPQRALDVVETALEDLDLAGLAHIPAGYLSAGQKRRLGLARLLVAYRPVWLLDEPTVSLDRRSVALVARIVNRHTAAGGIAIAATHLDLGLERTDALSLGRTAAAPPDVAPQDDAPQDDAPGSTTRGAS